MADVSHTILAKSDQLNFMDFGSRKMIVKITEVKVGNGDQPVAIFYPEHNGKPWKPSKGMIRLLCEAWGEESDNWIGKSVELYGEATVKWAGKEEGGIRISALSDIDKKGLTAFIAISRGKRRKATIPYLKVDLDQLTDIDKQWLESARIDPTELNQLEDKVFVAKIMSHL